MEHDPLIIRPHPGMQEEFLARSEFEVLFGGEAGAGSSWCMLFEPLLYKWVELPYFVCIFFRRESPQLGDLITQAMELYTPCGAKFVGQDPIYRRQCFQWPSGAKCLFSHMQTLGDMQNIHGHQYHRVYVNELTRFPEVMYLYMFSRVRGKQQDFPYGIRSDANPEEDNEGYLWVYDRFISKLRHQVLKPRWFLRVNGERDTEVPRGTPYATSRVFVPKYRRENPSLDAGYESRLHQLGEKYQRALLQGIWGMSSKPDQLVPTDVFQKALTGEVEFKPGPQAGGFDYAELGKDKCVLFWGKGNRPNKVEEWGFLKTGEAAQIIAARIRQAGLFQCRVGIDSMGPGVGVWHDLQQHHEQAAARVNPCRYKDKLFEEKMRKKYGYQFDSFRSLMWWKVREDFLAGEIDLSAFGSTDTEKGEGWWENFFMFQQELLAITYRVENGVIKIVSKKELRKADKLGRSPDRADAFMLWNTARDWDPTEEFTGDEGQERLDGYDGEEKDPDLGGDSGFT